ncbi:MAG: GTP 3',8-cyclase MoaA [Endomicrobiia bacterium]
MKELIDQYGRKINYLRISVTDRCNLRCIYCMPDSGIISNRHEEILTYEEILKIVQGAVLWGINKIRITGGEPLVRKNIVYLIGALAKIEGINDLSLTTNGVLLEEYCEDLKKIGLKRINISLDTLNRQKYKIITGTDALNKVYKGIKKVLQIGLNPVKINVVVMRGINDDEIVEFAKLTYDEPLHIRFIELMPVCNIRQNWRDKFIPNSEVKKYCQNLDKLEQINNFDNNVSVSYRFKNAKGTISFISPVSDPFCSKCCRLRLTSDGKLRLCLGSPKEIDLKSIVRNNQSTTDDFRQIFNFAVGLKPKGHCFNSVSYSYLQETMCQIGG